jgi:hypothetical protein
MLRTVVLRILALHRSMHARIRRRIHEVFMADGDILTTATCICPQQWQCKGQVYVAHRLTHGRLAGRRLDRAPHAAADNWRAPQSGRPAVPPASAPNTHAVAEHYRATGQNTYSLATVDR